MHRATLFTTLLLAIILSACGSNGDQSAHEKDLTTQIPSPQNLAANFKNPPNAAKPKTWFHAMSGNMSEEGITKDLESMAEVGIGGLLLFNVTQGIPIGNVPYNSDRHHEMITHAAVEAERLGLTFGVHNCDGWSSSGGPWVKPEESMKMVVWSQQIMNGIQAEAPILKQPTTRQGYYEDIAVLAYPTLPSELNDRDLPGKVWPSDEAFDTSLLRDGRIDDEARLGRGRTPDRSLWFAYPQPKTIRSAMAVFTDRNATVTLQTSPHGKRWTDVRELQKVRTGKGEWAVNDNFPPITARNFRLRFSQGVTLREANLFATCLIDNPLGRSSLARTEDTDLGDVATPPPSDVIDPATILNLTEYLEADGRLSYALPPGDWTVLRFGQTSTGATNLPASEEGRGLEVDKMSRPALKKHYDAFVGRVVSQAGAAAPNALRYVEIDSYEAGGQNWTTGFDELFEERKGYDLIPFLPLLAGRFIGIEEERVKRKDGAGYRTRTAPLRPHRSRPYSFLFPLSSPKAYCTISGKSLPTSSPRTTTVTSPSWPTPTA